jgi:3-hydroxybutyryl-CoA dehydrogenase
MKKIVVIGGGGLMGHGMVLACLEAPDASVVLLSRRQESVDHGLELLRHGRYGLGRAVERGRLTQDDADEMLGRLTTTTDYGEALAGADLVFETVPESPPHKQAVLALVEAHAPASAVVATGTSGIMIAELGATLADPGRLIGAHWFYPANVMSLIEVVRGEQSRADAVAMVIDFLTGIGKKPVAVNDAPGFFMTRFVNTFVAEAIRAVELGIAGPAEIDQMVKTGLGWPMGVFELLDDTASFDSWYHAQEYLHETCGDRYAIPPLARKVFLSGYRGASRLKPGSHGGWYEFLRVAR